MRSPQPFSFGRGWLEMGRQRGAISAAADGGDDGNFGCGSDGSGQSAVVTDIFVSYEEIDVTANFTGFGENSVSQTWKSGEQILQGTVQICVCHNLKLHDAAIFREAAKGAGDMEGDLHHFRFRGLEILADCVFRFAVDLALESGFVLGAPSIWMTAALTQTI